MGRLMLVFLSATFSSQVGLGSVLVLGAIGIFAAIGAFRSAGARTWRENAEAEKARADRLEREKTAIEKAKATLEKAKIELDAQWTSRQADANAAHAKELERLVERIHKLELEITELRARPTVDDLAAAVRRVESGLNDLHTDFSGQTGVLTEIRDALIAERKRDPSTRTRATDNNQL